MGGLVLGSAAAIGRGSWRPDTLAGPCYRRRHPRGSL